MRRRYGHLDRVLKRLESVSSRMEKMSMAEYIELVRDPRRMIMISFVSGVARGLGVALGATVVAALFLYGLGRLAQLNLPLIGDFIARIVRIVRETT